ncbi:MAG: pseudouridine synthase [Lachnospiraceae bacterium]|nr:pseudouridine synthase [Lachnospiraceae bacterium]
MGIRINKYLADASVASRREADKLVEQGLVTINGRIAQNADRVEEGDKVCLRGKEIHIKDEKHVVAFHKPVGVTCTRQDKFAKVTIEDVISYPVRLNYAGRLDRDSEGLLLLTNDGALIDNMMRGANGHEKEYVVKTDKKITDEFLAGMRKGVYLKELERKTRPCEVTKEGEYTFRIVLTQGLNRQIRRMCKEFGYEVRKLTRVRVLNITLDGLKTGELRRLEGEELETLYQMVGMLPPS